MTTNYKYIYGPVASWRLGSSLGIDLLSQESKVCSFDCIYCQLGTVQSKELRRKIYVPTAEVVREIVQIPDLNINYITFAGTGEPTLAANLGKTIKAVRAVRREPIAVLTNGSLCGIDQVKKELSLADLVVVKLDAFSQNSLREINRPAKGLKFEEIINGIQEFRKYYQGKIALQIMFISNNKKEVSKFVKLANQIRPDEIQINTPLRSCPVRPLGKEDICHIINCFLIGTKGIKIVSVYDRRPTKQVVSLSGKDTLRRRGKIK